MAILQNDGLSGAGTAVERERGTFIIIIIIITGVLPCVYTAQYGVHPFRKLQWVELPKHKP